MAYRLNLKDARSLAAKPGSYVECITCQKCVPISPAYIGRLSEGIKEVLEKQVGRYSLEFDGVVLAYDKVKVHSKAGMTSDIESWVFYSIFVDFYLFKPTPNSMLQVTVNKKTQSHTGFIAYGTINGAVFHKGESSYQVGETITVCLISIKSKQDTIQLLARFYDESEMSAVKDDELKQETDTNDNIDIKDSTIVLDEDLPQSPKMKKNKKKKSHRGEKENDKCVEDEMITDVQSEEGTSKKKKKKRKSHSSENENTSMLTEAENFERSFEMAAEASRELSSKKKKRKSHSRDDEVTSQSNERIEEVIVISESTKSSSKKKKRKSNVEDEIVESKKRRREVAIAESLDSSEPQQKKRRKNKSFIDSGVEV